MIDEKLNLNQALHGYSNGHRLLRISKRLDDSDTRKMTILSDLSGNEFVKGFEKYFTGYRLDNNDIVLACTWYANEMSRPGCVWTHSLIFNSEELYKYNENIGEIFGFFRKPSLEDDYAYYEHPIEISLNKYKEIHIDEEKLKYMIWCVWGNKKPIIIFDENSVHYEKEIIYLFLNQNDLLENDFSFCTGSVSLRNIENKIIKVQVAPNKISRSKMSINDKAYEARDISTIKNYPMWVNKVLENMRRDGLKDLKIFISGFSKKYTHSDYFSSFVKLYIGSKADIKETNLLKLLQMACAIFRDKKSVCNEIVILYNKGYFGRWAGCEDYIGIIKFLINNLWMDISLYNIEKLVGKGYKMNYLGAKKLFKAIIKEENSVIEKVLTAYAKIVPENEFADFTDLEYECCSTLITLNANFAGCSELWIQNKGYQQSIIRSFGLAEKEEGSIDKILSVILNNSEYDLAWDIYKALGKACFKSFWNYILQEHKNIKVKGIIDVVKKDVQGGLLALKNSLNDREMLLFLIGFVDSYDEKIKGFEEREVVKLYFTIKKQTCTLEEDEMLARFLIPICIIEDYIVPVNIAEFVFSIVNQLLATQTFPENEWEKLEKILPEVAYYNSWDRCKRLRKGFKKKGYPIKGEDKEELPIHLL